MKNLVFEELTIEQKLGLMMCERHAHQSEAEVERTIERVKNHAVACIQLPINSWGSDIIRRIKEVADYPILFINDMEQGYPDCDVPAIPAITLAAAKNKKYLRAFAKSIVYHAKKAGFNGTWGPVVDLLNGNGPCSVSRKFGDSPEKVLFVTEEIAGVFKEYGFMSTGKHYPSGGNRVDNSYFGYDSHMTSTFASCTEEEVINRGLQCYLGLMKQGLLPTIMTSHSLYKNIDPEHPVTLSKKMHDLIRDRGFDGVFFTDSLAMMGILQKYGEEGAYGLCVSAGNDIILPNYRTDSDECLAMIKRQYEAGAFTDEDVDKAVTRILHLLQFIGDTADLIPEFTDEDRECIDAIARDAVTAICDEGVEASLGDPDKRRLFVVLTPNGFKADAPAMEITEREWYSAKAVEAKILKEFKNSEVVFVPEFATAWENEQVLLAANRHDEIVVVTYCDTACYLGTDGLTQRTEVLIDCLTFSDKVSAILHFGNPFALLNIRHIKRKLFGYNSPASMPYAFDILAGKIPAKGELPFSIVYK